MTRRGETLKALTMEDDDFQKKRPRFLSDGDISMDFVS